MRALAPQVEFEHTTSSERGAGRVYLILLLLNPLRPARFRADSPLFRVLPSAAQRMEAEHAVEMV